MEYRTRILPAFWIFDRAFSSFHPPFISAHGVFLKRIIALENQIIAINEQGTFVNGEKIQEPYAFYSGENPSGINGPHGTSEVEAVKVPPGMLFVMGDNRDNSFDSRDPEFGFVEVKDIVGRPLLALWARDKRRIGRLIR